MEGREAKSSYLAGRLCQLLVSYSLMRERGWQGWMVWQPMVILPTVCLCVFVLLACVAGALALGLTFEKRDPITLGLLSVCPRMSAGGAGSAGLVVCLCVLACQCVCSVLGSLFQRGAGGVLVCSGLLP